LTGGQNDGLPGILRIMEVGMNRKFTIFDFLNTVIMLFIGIIMLYPIVYIFAISLSDSYYIAQNKITIFPMGFNIDAYKTIFSNNKIPRAYFNTLIYTGFGTFLSVLLTAISAYPLSKKNFFGRKFFMTAIIITMFFNGGIIPNFIIVQRLGMIDTIWAMLLPNAIWTFELLILKSFYESVSPSLYESAIIDGASEYRILFQLIIPLSKAAIASIALFYFMGQWNSYFIPMIYLNDSKKLPLQVVLREMLIYDGTNDSNLIDAAKITPEALKDATIFISMIPVMIVYPFAQKYFISGIMLGSVKG
jgi:ABC-type sugar transport system, permease component